MKRKPEKPEQDPVEFLTGMLVQLLRDIGFRCDLLGSSSLEMDISTVRRRAATEGIGFFTKTLPQLGKCLDQALSSCIPLPTDHAFKLSARSPQLPVFLGSLWKRIFDDSGMVAISGQEAQIEAVRAVRQVCFLFYKLELPYEPEVEAKVLRNFVDIDACLPLVDDNPIISLETTRALESARMAIWYVLKDYSPLSAVPRHGPGAVATGEKPWEKYNFSRYYPKLDKEWSYSDYFFACYGHLCDDLHRLEAMDTIHTPEAKVALVPKDSRGPRIISMEPLELQWIQQGVMRDLYSLMERPSSPTCGYVNFTNQEVNRRLALENSFDGPMVTMDLKDASDRVSSWLAKKLLPRHVFEKLDACRSEVTRLPDGSCIELRKFAPMGSGICFPIEALIFWALAVGTLKRIRRQRDMLTLPPVYVYGDDIVVHGDSYESIKQTYTDCFLAVNESKCCTGRFFRESCGMDAFKFSDVTPTRVKTLMSALPSPAACLSLVGYVNNLRGKGYTLTADYLQNAITDKIPFPVPVTRTSRDIPFAYYEPYLDAATQMDYLRSAFKIRFNKAYQRQEIRIPMCRPGLNTVLKEGWSGLLDAFVTRGGPPDPFGFQHQKPSGPDRYTVPHLVKLGWTWVSLERLTYQDPVGLQRETPSLS